MVSDESAWTAGGTIKRIRPKQKALFLEWVPDADPMHVYIYIYILIITLGMRVCVCVCAFAVCSLHSLNIHM